MFKQKKNGYILIVKIVLEDKFLNVRNQKIIVEGTIRTV